MKNKEVEIQVEVERIKPLFDLLEAKGEFLYESRQIDEYYTPAHRNFAAQKPVAEWLRIRREDKKSNSITYKNWHYENGRNMCFCDEYETEIGDSEQAKLIFNSLNFQKLTIVDKKRRCYRLNDYEIAIDEVENLGSFVELEYKGTDEGANVNKITTEMINFLKNLGVGEILKNEVGYAYQCLFPDEKIKKYRYK